MSLTDISPESNTINPHWMTQSLIITLIQNVEIDGLNPTVSILFEVDWRMLIWFIGECVYGSVLLLYNHEGWMNVFDCNIAANVTCQLWVASHARIVCARSGLSAVYRSRARLACALAIMESERGFSPQSNACLCNKTTINIFYTYWYCVLNVYTCIYVIYSVEVDGFV